MKGYIAIITAIILSLVMLIIATTLGSSAFFTRFNNLDFYFKKTSYTIGRSCLDRALLKLALNSSYAGNETYNIDSYSCSILTIENVGVDKVIKSKTQVNNANTNLKLTVNAATLSTTTA